MLASDSAVSVPLESQLARTDPRLLEWLVCPLTRTTLIYDSIRQELVSKVAHLAYPIRDGIPIMLPDEARSLDESDPAEASRRF